MDVVKALANCTNSKERKRLLKDIRKSLDDNNKKYPEHDFIEIPDPFSWSCPQLNCLISKTNPPKTAKDL